MGLLSSVTAQDLVPTIEVYAAENGGSSAISPVVDKTTYRLRVELPAEISHIYSIFGDRNNVPHVPAAWSDTYGESNLKPGNDMFFGMVPSLALHSFLTVGPEVFGSISWPSISSVDTVGAIAGWTADTPLTLGQNPTPLDDFGIFWMDPDGPVDYQVTNGAFPGARRQIRSHFPSPHPPRPCRSGKAWHDKTGSQSGQLARSPFL